jgi:tetratricopeptide (TPR) repeat protein
VVKHFKLLDKVLNFSAERYFKTAGDLFVYEGDYETALNMVNKTLEIEPDNTRALVLKGDILFCLNQDLEALKVLNRAIELNGQCAEAYISKAGILDVLGKHREALYCCNQAMAHIGKHNEYLLSTLYDQKLVLLVRLKKYREAQRLLAESNSSLTQEDYHYLSSCYRPFLDRGCKSRGEIREKAQKLSLKVIHGASHAP